MPGRHASRPALAVAAFALFALAACGVDGPPRPPPNDPEKRPDPGITITGSIGMGLSGGTTDLDIKRR